jgi:hypothetical protein
MTIDQDMLTYGLLLIASIFACALIYLVAKRSRTSESPRQNPQNSNETWYQGTVKQDWVPTRRIDFATQFEIGADNSDKPTEFRLLVEEQRIVESVAGNEKLEIQWRFATLDEAKTIVSHYNKYLHENSLINSVVDKSTSLPRPMTTTDAHSASDAA